MSNVAADAGYVVLTPLGAVLFASLGRHPVAGLCAAFAGVSGGYSAKAMAGTFVMTGVLTVIAAVVATFAGPAQGHLASGLSGTGRMVEPPEILGALIGKLTPTDDALKPAVVRMSSPAKGPA